ncbi:MAG: DUF2852 domain-containing protein [Pseudomonadota bacterium]
MTSIPMEHDRQSNHTPVPVQILGMILFAGFAIPVTIVAMVHFWPAGVALAIILGWRGTFAFGANRGMNSDDIAKVVAAIKPETQTASRPSGNASFDRYRDDMLNRLEMEQENFETFLDRLRDAKDEVEFDTFMDERAAKISRGE